MKYLFLDIECSNCFDGEGKMCEFGYVLTDEKFNIIERDDIPMNPGRGGKYRFDLGIFDRDPSFQYAYDFDYYFAQDEFSAFYNRIKKLFDGEVKVFGYAVDNDMRYLDYTLKRYGFKSFEYTSYDAQSMIAYYSSRHPISLGLQDAVKAICNPQELITLGIEPHLSRDDATMTMLVIRDMLKNLNFSMNDMIEACPKCKRDSKEYLEKFYARKAEREAHPELFTRHGHGHKKNSAQVAWGDFYRSYESQLEDEKVIGKLTTVSAKVKEKLSDTLTAINYMKANGLVPYDRIGGSDYIVVLDEADEKRLFGILKHPYKGKVIHLSEVAVDVDKFEDNE